MRYGAIFPQTEIGIDPIAIRDYAQAVEDLGYDYLLAYDHVLGADPEGRGGTWPYTYMSNFHEPLALFSYLAGLTERIELVSGVVILPQRQTALVAKQAAVVDILTGGRLILGVGSGWNYLEYESLGQDFHTRGRRLEEQVGLLRRLWSEPLVEFEGDFDRIPAVGINPRPGRQIPIWMGGTAPVVLDRIGRIGDGWVAGRGDLEFSGAASRRSARRRSARVATPRRSGSPPQSRTTVCPRSRSPSPSACRRRARTASTSSRWTSGWPRPAITSRRCASSSRRRGRTEASLRPSRPCAPSSARASRPRCALRSTRCCRRGR